MSNHYLRLLPKISTLIFDVDGVLTDGKITIMPNGDQIRKLNAKDGFAIQLAIKKGLRICIISGGHAVSVKMALERLGIEEVYMGVKDKLACYNDIKVMYDLQDEHIMYMGDDLPDYEVIQQVGVGCCPNDAAREILDISKYISDRDGGKGCVRDIIEKVLRAKGEWMSHSNDIKG